MVRKEEETLKGDISIHSESTTESSDSYSYLLRDIENPNNHINEEWDAIERTLYQESGKHVTDPVLLKECKLWRETFPHIRVRGTAIKVEQPEGLVVQSTKSVHAIDKNHIALSKLNEKREKIKKTVVSHIVERLINKLNVNKENSVVSQTLIELGGKGGGAPLLNSKSSGTQSEKESYFERGKKVETKGKPGKSQAEEYVPSVRSETDDESDIVNDFEYNFSTDYLTNRNKPSLWSGYSYNEKPIQMREYTSNLAKSEEILRSGNMTFKIAGKNSTLAKRGQTLDSASADIKPFEITKKIDKKYEAMLEKILESKGFGVDGSNAKKSSKPEISSYRESISKHNRDDVSCRKNKQLPKLNNFTNHWMNRGDQRLHDLHGIIPRNFFRVSNNDPIGSVKSRERRTKSQASRSGNKAYQCEKFLEEIRGEMEDYTITVKKDYEEEINSLRPQFYSRYNKNYTARTQKSSSCGDLPKKNPKSCNRTLKSGLEKRKNELTMRSETKKTGKRNQNQNIQLPPIESSIICTEIIGRPKIGPRALPKKCI